MMKNLENKKLKKNKYYKINKIETDHVKQASIAILEN